MNHLNKTQDARRRWARGDGNVKFKVIKMTYMKNAEFKARQLWLDFQDAAGTAIEVMSESIETARIWLKKFLKEFKMPEQKQEKKQKELNLKGGICYSR